MNIDTILIISEIGMWMSGVAFVIAAVCWVWLEVIGSDDWQQHS